MVFGILQRVFVRTASCFENSNEPNFYPKRADLKALKEIFLKYASVHKNNEIFMTENEFVNGFFRFSSNENDNIKLLGGIFDTSKDGLISFSKIQEFEELLYVPDDLYVTAFQHFDTKRKGKITPHEFQYHAHNVTRITPIEVDILFELCKLNTEQGKEAINDLQSIDPQNMFFQPVLLSNKNTDDKQRNSPFWTWGRGKTEDTPELVDLSAKGEQGERSYIMSVLESVYRLTVGFMAGGTGAAAVYPIDLVKTRMQNQRINPETGEKMYRHSFDCFSKVIKNEGVRGLYRGLLPQICGVAPEKAIKLSVNDFLRDHLREKDGSIKLWAETLAGACGGASQVIFCNPVEIIKIQLQIAGEVKGGPRPRALQIFKEKFFFGLYKGATACFCRDITFAAIYLPTYANTKKFLADENGYNPPHTLLIAGVLGGIPAASLATPFDVVKTRLQVKPRSGQTTYNGFTDVVKKVWKEEGWTAFWKGAGARVCKSSPQLGITLVTYELLQRLLYFDFGGSRPEGSERKSTGPKKVSYNQDQTGGYEAAIPMITGIETQFGIAVPKFNIVTISPSKEKKDEPEE